VASTAIASKPVTVRAALAAADPAFFEALGIPIVRGQGFGSFRGLGEPPAAILTQHTALSLFDTTDVVGRYVVVRRNVTYRGEPLEEPRLVVGVAADVESEGPQGPTGTIYVPFGQHFDLAVVIAARGYGASPALGLRLRELVRRVEPDLAIASSASGEALAQPGMEIVRIIAELSGGLGLVALALSMVGLYAMLSFAVRHRTREVGVRMALGAHRGAIIRMVVAQGMRPVLTGLALGLGAGGLLHFALRAVYARAFPDADPLVVLLLVVPFVIAGVLACYLPARRAAHLDPNVALREL
jgi:putative ABC transport system permease protein